MRRKKRTRGLVEKKNWTLKKEEDVEKGKEKRGGGRSDKIFERLKGPSGFPLRPALIYLIIR